MLIFYGKRTVRIKKTTDNKKCCSSCGEYDFEVNVYRDYNHVLFVPIMPKGDKKVEIICHNCGQPIHSDVLESHYRKSSRTIPYLYSIPLLLFCLIITFLIFNLNPQIETSDYSENSEINNVFVDKTDKLNSPSSVPFSSTNNYSISDFYNTQNYQNFTRQSKQENYFVKDNRRDYFNSDFRNTLHKRHLIFEDRNNNSKSFNRSK